MTDVRSLGSKPNLEDQELETWNAKLETMGTVPHTTQR